MSLINKIGVCLFLLLLSSEFIQAQEMCSRCRQRERSACDLSCESLRSSKERGRCRESCLLETCSEDCGGGKTFSRSPDRGPSNEGDSNSLSELDQLTGTGERTGTGGRSGDSDLSCHGCLKSARYGDCRAQCVDSRFVERCIGKCAKSKCVDACPLPALEKERSPYRSGRRERCYMCESRAGSDCRMECGYDAAVPGFTACKIACVKRKCRTICGPAS